MTFQIEFPDYPAADMPAIPAGFEDSSWHDDACPCFINEGAGLIIWVDFANPSDREFPDQKRFYLNLYDQGPGDEILATDDWSEVIAAVERQKVAQ